MNESYFPEPNVSSLAEASSFHWSGSLGGRGVGSKSESGSTLSTLRLQIQFGRTALRAEGVDPLALSWAVVAEEGAKSQTQTKEGEKKRRFSHTQTHTDTDTKCTHTRTHAH